METYHECNGVNCNVELSCKLVDMVIYPMKQNGKCYCATCFKSMRSRTFTNWFLNLCDISETCNWSEETISIGKICEL